MPKAERWAAAGSPGSGSARRGPPRAPGDRGPSWPRRRRAAGLPCDPPRPRWRRRPASPGSLRRPARSRPRVERRASAAGGPPGPGSGCRPISASGGVLLRFRSGITTIGNSSPLAWWIDIRRIVGLSSSVVAACSSRGGLSRSARSRATRSASVKLSWRSKSRARRTSLRVLASLRAPRNSQTRAASKPDSSRTAATRLARGITVLQVAPPRQQGLGPQGQRPIAVGELGDLAGPRRPLGEAARELARQPEERVVAEAEERAAQGSRERHLRRAGLRPPRAR